MTHPDTKREARMHTLAMTASSNAEKAARAALEQTGLDND